MLQQGTAGGHGEALTLRRLWAAGDAPGSKDRSPPTEQVPGGSRTPEAGPGRRRWCVHVLLCTHKPLPSCASPPCHQPWTLSRSRLRSTLCAPGLRASHGIIWQCEHCAQGVKHQTSGLLRLELRSSCTVFPSHSHTDACSASVRPPCLQSFQELANHIFKPWLPTGAPLCKQDQKHLCQGSPSGMPSSHLTLHALVYQAAYNCCCPRPHFLV